MNNGNTTLEVTSGEAVLFNPEVKQVEPHTVPHGQLENDVKLSGAVTNNATKLAFSGQPYDIVASVERIAKGKLKSAGLITEKFNLNGEKLTKSVIADYRAHHPSVYGARDRVPVNIVEQIENAVGEFIVNKLAKNLTPQNTVSFKRSFVFRRPKLGDDNDYEQWVLKLEALGEERAGLKEQLFASNCEITRIEKRLKDLMAKKTPDHALEKRYNERLLRMQREASYLKGEIERQNGVIQEAKNVA